MRNSSITSLNTWIISFTMAAWEFFVYQSWSEIITESLAGSFIKQSVKLLSSTPLFFFPKNVKKILKVWIYYIPALEDFTKN